MPSRLPEAIVTRWDAQALGTTFTGGIHFEEAPEETAFPYVVMTMRATGDETHTNTSKFRGESVQLMVFAKEGGVLDPVSQMGTYLRTLEAAFDGVTLSMPSSEGYFLVSTVGSMVITPVDEDVWAGTIDVSQERRRPFTASCA